MTLWVIVPFSRPQFASRVATNFSRQTNANARLVIVENGAALGAWRPLSPDDVVVRSSTATCSAAMNAGLAAVRELARAGDVFCKWDDDDIYLEPYLSEVEQVFELHPQVRVTGKCALWVRAEDDALWFLDGPQECVADAMLPRGPTIAARVAGAPDFPTVARCGTDTAWLERVRELGWKMWLTSARNFVWCRYPREHGHVWLPGIAAAQMAFGDRLRLVVEGSPVDARPTLTKTMPLDVASAFDRVRDWSSCA